MDHYERSKLADAIKEEKYIKDDYIIKEVINIILIKINRERVEMCSIS